jgi:L-fuconolactonase
MIIDSHHHLWNLELRDYSWMSPELKPLNRNFLEDDLISTVQPFGISGTVTVQAHQSLEETRWLLKIADKSNLILGVVGWADLKDPNLDRTLHRLKGNSKFKGVRHLIQDEPDVSWMLQPEVIRGLRMLHEAGLTYDLLVKPPQLENALRLAAQLPDMLIIVDHIAKPYIKAGTQELWASQMKELAQSPRIYCKISGLITEADHQHWKETDFVFYLEHILNVFGWDRVCWGSDWPVCLMAGDYSQVLKLPEKILRSSATQAQWDAFMGGNALKFYGLL